MNLAPQKANKLKVLMEPEILYELDMTDKLKRWKRMKVL